MRTALSKVGYILGAFAIAVPVLGVKILVGHGVKMYYLYAENRTAPLDLKCAESQVCGASL